MSSNGERGKWHGTNIRGAMAFSYDRETASPDLHPVQFDQVVARLTELSQQRDGNGWPIVKFVFTRFDHTSPVVAYQWTSEWADHKFDSELVALGSSLGRGMWKVFGSDPVAKYDFDRYVR